MWLKCRKEGGEHPILGWSHLPQSLPFSWQLGPLDRLNVQGKTLTVYSPASPALGILVLSGIKLQLISVLALQMQPAASCTGIPASQPIPQPRSQHLPKPQLRSQGSSPGLKALQSPSPTALKTGGASSGGQCVGPRVAGGGIGAGDGRARHKIPD